MCFSLALCDVLRRPDQSQARLWRREPRLILTLGVRLTGPKAAMQMRFYAGSSPILLTAGADCGTDFRGLAEVR